MFEKATRLKLRFDTAVGSISVEDLWDLPLTSERKANLDDVARFLARKIKETETESFVNKPTKTNEELQLKFEIVKYIIGVRLAENSAAAEARDRKEKKEKLLALIDRKKNEKLEGMSLEDLEAQVAAL